MGGKGGGNQHIYDMAPSPSQGSGGWVYNDTGTTQLPIRQPVQVEPKPIDEPPPVVKPPPVETPDLSFLSKNFGHYENMGPLGDALVRGLGSVSPQQMQGQV